MKALTLKDFYYGRLVKIFGDVDNLNYFQANGVTAPDDFGEMLRVDYDCTTVIWHKANKKVVSFVWRLADINDH